VGTRWSGLREAAVQTICKTFCVPLACSDMDYACRMCGLLRKHTDRLVSTQGIITGMTHYDIIFFQGVL